MGRLGPLIIVIAAVFSGCGGTSHQTESGFRTEISRQGAIAQQQRQAESEVVGQPAKAHPPKESKSSASATSEKDDGRAGLRSEQGDDEKGPKRAAEDALQSAGGHLSQRELREVAEESIARTERILHPPQGKSPAEVIREIEAELKASTP